MAMLEEAIWIYHRNQLYSIGGLSPPCSLFGLASIAVGFATEHCSGPTVDGKVLHAVQSPSVGNTECWLKTEPESTLLDSNCIGDFGH